jgi:SnoaL-like domain
LTSGHQPEITFDGPRAAHGALVWAMSGLIAVPGTNPVKGVTDHGYYTDGYARDDGVWRISRSRLDLLRLDPLPGGLPGS